MNIFYLHTDTNMNTSYHVDQHVRKMAIETAQMLCTNLRVKFRVEAPFEGPERLHRPAYINHPCTEWVGETFDNFAWTWLFGVDLCNEFSYRWNKPHGVRDVYTNILALQPDPDKFGPIHGMTERPKCVAPEFKQFDHITAYRLQYLAKKRRLFEWTARPVPHWIEDTSWVKEL